jgi:rubredoxin
MIKLSYGQSVYTPDPGKVPEGEQVVCGVCGAVCNEHRGVMGPRSYAASVGGKRFHELHDTFMCPNYECPPLSSHWHGVAEKLMWSARNEKSPTLAAIYAQDAERIVKERRLIKWQPKES